MGTVITAIAAQKGGTGKTALTGSLGPLWAYTGARTLLIDLDQQANLTFAFGVNPRALEGTVVDVLAPRNPMDDRRGDRRRRPRRPRPGSAFRATRGRRRWTRSFARRRWASTGSRTRSSR